MKLTSQRKHIAQKKYRLEKLINLFGTHAAAIKILYIYTVMRIHYIFFSQHAHRQLQNSGILDFVRSRREFDSVVQASYLAKIAIGNIKDQVMGTIHDKVPRETVGRETTNRFRMQFQAAAFAALEILSGKGVDRVFCDYHDDFVVRHSVKGSVEYHFFQVKTKGRLNQQWKVDEIFALKKKGKLDTETKLNAIRESIAGKLFVHTIEFGEECREVTVLSNVHFQDDVFEVQEHLRNGKSERAYIAEFIEKFGAIFSPGMTLSEDQVIKARKKLSLVQASYIGETLEQFTDAARNAIWKHSEIDLQRNEVDGIANSLVALVEAKSCAPIRELTKDKIEVVTGIGIDDLLKVLSISTTVYRNLLNGDDPAAIKTASILQRELKVAGATENMIEVASRAKVSWDVWLRTARHTYPEFDLELLLNEIDAKCRTWVISGGVLSHLSDMIDEILVSSLGKKFPPLNVDMLLGAFCSSIVRRASR